MKRINYFALFVLCLLATACQQDELFTRPDGRITVNATIEEVSSRSLVDGNGNFTWNTGDQIGVWATVGNGTAAFKALTLTPETVGEKKGLFEAVWEGTTVFSHYAVYPYSTEHTIDDQAALTVNLPSAYGSTDTGYSLNTNAVMVANIGAETQVLGDLDFHHVGGVVSVKVSGLPEKTCGVRLTASKGITGSFVVSNPGTNAPVIEAATQNKGKNDNITINFPKLTETSGEMHFFFPVPTGTYTLKLEYLVASEMAANPVVAHVLKDEQTENIVGRCTLLDMPALTLVSAGANTEDVALIQVDNNEKAVEALAAITGDNPSVNVLASSEVTKWVLPANFTSGKTDNSRLNITYKSAPSELTVIEEELDTKAVTTTTTLSRGKVTIFIPKGDTEVTLSKVDIKTPNLTATLNEGATGEITVTELLTTAANFVLGSKVKATYAQIIANGQTEYIASTPEALLKVSGIVRDKKNKTPITENITLGDDIVLAETTPAETNWEVIGATYNNPYTGTFDGKGYTITGLTIVNATKAYQGLIGYLGENGVIKDVKLSNCQISSSAQFTGGLAGYNAKGLISGCTLEGNSSLTSSCTKTQGAYIGGITGHNNFGTVSNCHVTNSAISSTQMKTAGGIAGMSTSATISDCTIGNAVSVSATQLVGGIVGYSYGTGASVSNCTVSGETITLSATGTMVGGIVGQNYHTKVENCHVSGKVSISGTGYIGGIAGTTRQTGAGIMDCTVTATNKDDITITGTTGDFVGGIAGSNLNTGIIYNSKATLCSIKAGGMCVGGIVGTSHSYVYGCTSINNSVEGSSRVGGILGQNTMYTAACHVNNATLAITSENEELKKRIGSVVGENGNTARGGYLIACYAYACSANLVGTNYGYDETKDPPVVGPGATITACYINKSGETTVSSVNAAEEIEPVVKSGVKWTDALDAMNAQSPSNGVNFSWSGDSYDQAEVGIY